MLMNLSSLTGNWTGTPEIQLSPETTLDGEPVGTELGADPEATPAAAGPPQAPPQGASGQPATPFHSWTDPTGKVHAFASAKELSDSMTKSHFLQSDYSKKTEALKGREGQISAREKALNEQARKLKEMEGKYSTFRNALSQRPELFNQFSQMLGQPGSPGEALTAAQEAIKPMIEEIRSELAEIKEWKSGQDWEKQRGGIHEKLAGELGGGYSREAVENFLASVKEDDPESLFRFAHHALQGQQDPILAQKRAADQAAANQRHRGVLPGSGQAPAAKAPKTIDEGRAQALADLS